MRADAAIAACPDYEAETCRAALRQVLAPFGGLAWVKPGMRIAVKANLVSVNVNRLVGDGYLERRAVEGDRRQTELVPTEAAQPIIRRGREIQERFCRELLDGMSEERKAQFHETVEIMEGNLDRILGEE